jgi:hypothetical protein
MLGSYEVMVVFSLLSTPFLGEKHLEIVYLHVDSQENHPSHPCEGAHFYVFI